MTASDIPPPTWYFIDMLGRYVLAPLDLATDVAELELAEIKEEQTAFDEFSERLGRTPSIPECRSMESSPCLVLGNSKSESMSSICATYRETVMAVSHYDEVYDEGLLENIAMELGSDLAGALDQETHFANIEMISNGFSIAAARASHRRHALGEAIEMELVSIERAHQKLVELVCELDTTIVPDWYQTPFLGRLNDISRERQETIHGHPSPAKGSSNLCEYLYHDQPWTFPVLTAIARVRESVDLGRGTGGNE